MSWYIPASPKAFDESTRRVHLGSVYARLPLGATLLGTITPSRCLARSLEIWSARALMCASSSCGEQTMPRVRVRLRVRGERARTDLLCP